MAHLSESQARDQARTGAGRRADSQASPQGFDAVTQALKAAPRGVFHVEAAAAVANFDSKMAVGAIQPDLGGRGPRMLENVGEALGDQEVRRTLDILAKPPPGQCLRALELHVDGKARDACSHRGGEPVIGENCRMDPGDQPAKILQGLMRLLLHRCKAGFGLDWISRQLGSCRAYPGRQRNQLLLDSVMKVTLDSPAFHLLRLNEPGPRTRELSRQPSISNCECRLLRDRVQELAVLRPILTL